MEQASFVFPTNQLFYWEDGFYCHGTVQFTPYNILIGLDHLSW